MVYFNYLFFIILPIFSHLASGSPPVVTIEDSLKIPVKNQSRDGRGILDTIKSVVQTVQTVNKLFGSTNSNPTFNQNSNNYDSVGTSYPVNGNYQQYQPQQPQQSQIISNQYGTVPQPQFSPQTQIHDSAQSQMQQHYPSFPVSSTLNFNNNNNNGYYPGTVTNVVNNKPGSVNKQGVGSSNLLSSVGELGILEDLTDLFSFSNVEKVLNNVNKFDSLQCIPRIVCQTIAKRTQEAAESAKTSTTTTRRPKSRGNKNRNGRFIPGLSGLKIQGVDTALEQFVKFLELMQLKDWAVYPYLQGAYQGNSVKSWDECAEKFSTCPFSEDQLLYYFNNYKGGLFQSFRSDLPN